MRRPPTAPALRDLPQPVRQRIEEFAAFAKMTCDHYGAEPWTGYAVAGELVQGLTREWAEKHAAETTCTWQTITTTPLVTWHTSCGMDVREPYAAAVCPCCGKPVRIIPEVTTP